MHIAQHWRMQGYRYRLELDEQQIAYENRKLVSAMKDYIEGRYQIDETESLLSVISAADRMVLELVNFDEINQIQDIQSIGLKFINLLRDNIEALSHFNLEKVAIILGVYPEYQVIRCYLSDDEARIPTMLHALSNGHVGDSTKLAVIPEASNLRWPIINWINANRTAEGVDFERIVRIFELGDVLVTDSYEG